MQRRGWSESQFAREMGEHPNWVILRLNGKTAIKIEDLLRMAAKLEVTPAWLFQEDGPDELPVPGPFREAFRERRGQAVRETGGAWSAGVLEEVVKRDRELYSEGVLRAINRLSEHDRQTALRLIGLLDHVLSKADLPE